LKKRPSLLKISQVADVRDWLAAELRRSSSIVNDQRELIGEDARESGRLPVRSCLARNQSRMAAWPLVKE
jgi:hypothetical protein